MIQQEKPYDTRLTINGLYNVKSPQKPVEVSFDREKDKTYITISTIRGENYTLLLQQADN